MSHDSPPRVGRFVSEVAVIVLGVLIALFAESAWTERGERAEERRILERLADELAEDSLALRGLRGWSDEAGGSIARVGAILEGGDTLPVAAGLAHVYSAATAWTLASPTSTWDELVQAGRIAVVDDAEVRRLAVTYYDVREETEDDVAALGEDPFRRAIVSILPSNYTYAVLVDCLRNPASVDVDGMGAEVWVGAEMRASRCEIEPEEGATVWLDRLRRRDGLDEALGERAYLLRIMADQLERTRAAQSALRARLAVLGYEAAG